MLKFYAIKKRFDDALVVINKGLNSCSEGIDFLKLKLLILSDLRKWDDVLCLSNEILKIENDCELTWNLKFDALENLNKVDELILAYDEVFKIFENDSDLKKDKTERLNRL
ncbi:MULTISPECIES: hypothetical protein [Methanobrevibacter]|uniref:hypothetical protein n=1 Tax=Methanobrevibacter TaxID=2172 RepID=UPI00084C4DF9|nr:MULTISPECIES: hypothetical protein [Methanobrevibacter]OEC94295.1 hypothetical protein A9505_08865 [Methanobrevibacter sp. A27]